MLEFAYVGPPPCLCLKTSEPNWIVPKPNSKKCNTFQTFLLSEGVVRGGLSMPIMSDVCISFYLITLPTFWTDE